MSDRAIRRILGIETSAPERDPDIPYPSRDFEPGTPGDMCVHADPDVLREREEEYR